MNEDDSKMNENSDDPSENDEWSHPIPEEHREAISILFEESCKRDKCVRRAEEKYLEAHDILWDKLYEVTGLDRSDPRWAKLLYDHPRGLIVEGGKNRMMLKAELDATKVHNHALVIEIRETKKAMVAAQRFECAHAASELEKMVKDLLIDVRDARAELLEVKQLPGPLFCDGCGDELDGVIHEDGDKNYCSEDCKLDNDPPSVAKE
jgi:hypothetical protein